MSPLTHNTKIRRALEIAEIGARPNSAAAMLGYIPPEVVEKLSSALLATMIDNLWGACVASKAVAARQFYEKHQEAGVARPVAARADESPSKVSKPLPPATRPIVKSIAKIGGVKHTYAPVPTDVEVNVIGKGRRGRPKVSTANAA